MNTLSLFFYYCKCHHKYRKTVYSACKWLGIRVPPAIAFLPAELIGKNTNDGRFNFKKNIIVIFVSSSSSLNYSKEVASIFVQELIHYFQNKLGLDMTLEDREKEAIALTNAYFEKQKYKRITRGAIWDYLSPVAGGEAPDETTI